MPAPRYIPAQENSNWLGETLKSFIGDRTEKLKESQESDALQDIYKQYEQDGKNLEKTIFDIQSRPGISPTTRVNTIKQLMEFKEHNTKIQKEAKDAADKASQVRAIEKQRGLQPGSLSEFDSNPSLANTVTKEPKGNQADRGIDEDQLRRIEHTMASEEYQNASPSEKNVMLIKNRVSKENAKAIVDPDIEAEKNAEGKKYREGREKSVSDYVEKTKTDGDNAEDMKFSLAESRRAIEGDITGPGYKALLKENPYSQIILGLTPDEALLQASNKKLLEGSKGLFGPKPTEREIFLLLNSMLPSIGKTKEANLAGLDFIEKINDMKILKSEIVNEITDGGEKYVPNIQQVVQERMKPLVEQLKIELNDANKKFEGTEKIKVTAPDGSVGMMTKKQIEEAKKQNVIFTPVK